VHNLCVISKISADDFEIFGGDSAQINEEAALLRQLEGDSNSEENDGDSASAQVIGADDMLFSDFDADKDPKSLSPGEMETCLNEMQMAASRSHGSVWTDVSVTRRRSGVTGQGNLIRYRDFTVPLRQQCHSQSNRCLLGSLNRRPPVAG